jgi:undecaprenyl-diphosphatase
MTAIIVAIILGIVEGLTEFLPVSSTGHLILVNQFATFKSKEFTDMFDIVIQFGAVLAVILYFWKRIFPFGQSVSEQKNIWDLWLKVIIAFIPAAVLGFLLDEFIEEKLMFPLPVSIALIVGGIVLLFMEKILRKPSIEKVSQLSYSQAFIIGLVQCLAMIPGTSRSAATIIGAMALGCSRTVAAEFSFFLAIPTIGAASAYKLLKFLMSDIALSTQDFANLAVGFLVSFVSAWLVISVFMIFISKNNFTPFGIYRIALGIIMLIWLYAF